MAKDGPLPAFCARLKRLQQASGLTQNALARHAGLGKSQMSAILNGGIKRLPDWDVVQQVVHVCVEYAAKTGRQLPLDLREERDWQRRYGDLEQDTEVAERPRRRSVTRYGRPIDRWDPFNLGVHHPIAAVRRSSRGPVDLPLLPPYVLREHDQQLREQLDPRRPGPRMAVLTGQSCTGKTRAAYEAVLSCLPEWQLVRPETSADLVHLLADEKVGSETVIWLNETQAYLDGEHGEEAAAALRRLLTSTLRVVVVGTMWDTDWRALTARPAAGSPGYPQARELLDQSAVKIAVPASFTQRTLTELCQAAGDDPRLAEAFHAAWETGGIAQVLAGGPWLIDFYTDASPHIKAVLDAAIDAWLLGHHAPLPAALLEEAAAGYLDERQRAVSAAWFNDALAQVTTKIKGAVAPLTALRTSHGAGEPDGYLVADYLLQHASNGRPSPLQPVELWDALASYTTGPADHVRIAQAAVKRNYRRHADLHFRSVVESNNGDSPPVRLAEVPVPGTVRHGHNLMVVPQGPLVHLVALGHSQSGSMSRPLEDISGDLGQAVRRGLAELLEQAGHLREAAELQRYLAQRGDKPALARLAELLEQIGQIDEAAATWRRLAGSDDMDVYSMRSLTSLLARAGRIDEAVEVSQQLADRGYDYAVEALAGLLEEAEKRDEAVAVWQLLARRGDIYAMRMLARLLEQVGQIDAAAAVWQPAAEHDETYAMEGLAGVLERAGRIDDAVAVWQPAAQAGEVYAMRALADMLERAGRIDEAIALWEPAAERGDSSAMEAVARLLDQVGQFGLAVVMQQRLAASDQDSDYPMRALADMLERAGQTDDAVAVWRRADERGDPLARGGLAGVLERAGRIDDAVAVWQPAAQAGDIYAMRALADMLERAGQTHAAVTVWEPAAQEGNTAAMRTVAELLDKAGQIGLAEWWLRKAAQHGDAESLADLAGLLQRGGWADEADQVKKFGLEPDGRTADPWA
ncbi:MAG TPA: helix-turn-helix domain-containing protein [Streptosporangiaceae bacterium]|nr:helix-turn-helix domain-containing protein [Streptosporangiaceae bacterium]